MYPSRGDMALFALLSCGVTFYVSRSWHDINARSGASIILAREVIARRRRESAYSHIGWRLSMITAAYDSLLAGR